MAGLVASCGGGPTAADIQKLPEASFIYPGATVVSTSSSDAKLPYAGAFVVVSYQSSAPWSAISAFYREKLVALGYEAHANFQTGGDPTDWYTKDSRSIDLIHTTGYNGSAGSATEYEYDIQQR